MASPRDALDRAFRAEVGALRGRRRLFPLRLHVGSPGGERRSVEVPWPVPQGYDAGLRFDLVAAVVEDWLADRPDGAAPWAWLTRPGLPEVHDVDLAWFAATTRAFGAHETSPAGFRVVTRTGWFDLESGERRVWRRLRL